METDLSPKLGYRFKDKALLAAATHSSYANEVKDKKVQYNERLEFLGDSVLNMLAAEYLYSRFNHLPEGDLTKMRALIVCEAHFMRLRKNQSRRIPLPRQRRGAKRREAARFHTR